MQEVLDQKKKKEKKRKKKEENVDASIFIRIQTNTMSHCSTPPKSIHIDGAIDLAIWYNQNPFIYFSILPLHFTKYPTSIVLF